jgi:hypothetical protein
MEKPGVCENSPKVSCSGPSVFFPTELITSLLQLPIIDVTLTPLISSSASCFNSNSVGEPILGAFALGYYATSYTSGFQTFVNIRVTWRAC